jgi:hypothetical protein
LRYCDGDGSAQVILSNRGNQYPNEPGRRILVELAAAGE